MCVCVCAHARACAYVGTVIQEIVDYFGVKEVFPDFYESMSNNKWRSNWVAQFVNNETASTKMAASFSRAWSDLNTPAAFKQYTMTCPEKECSQEGFYAVFHRTDHAAFWALGWPAFHISDACVRSNTVTL